MTELNTEQLVIDVLSKIDQPGQIENWADVHMEGSIPTPVTQEACVGVTKNLLQAVPPRTGEWEHFLVTLAAHSRRSKRRVATESCEAAIVGLLQLLDDGALDACDEQKVVTVANALIVTLAAQRKLRQDIEEVIGRICDKWTHLLPQIGEQCQHIWKRKGQMSGEPGLFLWDKRNQAWRLATDFRQYGDA